MAGNQMQMMLLIPMLCRMLSPTLLIRQLCRVLSRMVVLLLVLALQEAYIAQRSSVSRGSTSEQMECPVHVMHSTRT